MIRTFIQTKEFEKNWISLGFSDESLRKLEILIMKNPQVGAVVQGTGRLRKMRFAYDHRGKSKSIRICYVDFESKETIYLITVYAKSKQENLSMTEQNNVKKLISVLEKSM